MVFHGISWDLSTNKDGMDGMNLDQSMMTSLLHISGMMLNVIEVNI